MTNNQPQAVEHVQDIGNTSAIAPVVASAKALQKKVEEEVALRKVLTEYITQHMKDGIDFGAIHISKKCQTPYSCTNKTHYSKPCLFKPGAEKFLSLMKFTIIYTKDDETWEMAGRQQGLFCYKASVLDHKGRIVGEGRGACSIQEKQNTNTAIKIAEKRAKIDAVLSTGGLSDFFTQDLEDATAHGNSVSRGSESDFTNEKQKDDDTYMITPNQVKYITDLLHQRGYSAEQLAKKYDVTTLEELTAEQASLAINSLLQLPKKETASTTEPEDRATPPNLVCAKCGAAATERSGQTKGGKNYHGIFCSTEDKSHTRWLWN